MKSTVKYVKNGKAAMFLFKIDLIRHVLIDGNTNITPPRPNLAHLFQQDILNFCACVCLETLSSVQQVHWNGNLTNSICKKMNTCIIEAVDLSYMPN